MTARIRSAFAALLCVLALTATGALQLPAAAPAPQQASRPRAIPQDPFTAIVEAFRMHDIVTIPDWHGDPALLAFSLAVLRDPRVHAVVNDIVIETGNSRYQTLMDRYVRGEAVASAELRQVWQNTVRVGVNTGGDDNVDVPAMFEAVRAVNMSLPRERQLRVLLGDPPIDWDVVKTPADHQKWLEMRDSYPAALIQVEVLAKRRRALVIYGQGHTARRQLASNYDMEDWREQTLVSNLERATSTRVFSLWRATELETLQPDASSWPVPSLSLVRGTALGALDFAVFAGGARLGSTARFSVRDNKIVPVPRDQWRTLPMEEQFDAVLHLGPMPTNAAPGLSPSMCTSRTYQEHVRRLALGAPPGEVERVRQFCATASATVPR